MENDANISSAMAREFQENGAVLIRNLLSPELLAECRKVYDEALLKPVSKGAQVKYPDGSLYNPGVGFRTEVPLVLDLIHKGPFASVLSTLWESENVWFFDHEIWWKRHGTADHGRCPTRSDTPFHQDSGAVPFRGPHIGLFWICFEPVPKENCLHTVKGSHQGPLYQLAPGTLYGMDPVKPSVPATAKPIMPMTAKERAGWEYCAWDLQPGDVVVMHPGGIHGWAPVDPTCPERNTLVIRFVGDDCWFSQDAVVDPETGQVRAGLWTEHMKKVEATDGYKMKEYQQLRPGDHFSSFLKPETLLLGPGMPIRPQDDAAPGTASKL